MKINQDHMYHGAALTQIAEHPQFTAINAFREGDGISRSAFRINDDVGVFLKYARNPRPSFDEYQFTFSTFQLQELKRIANKVRRVFLALVCVHARQICCLPLNDFDALLDRRKRAVGKEEEQYVLLVTALTRKSFRVYINAPGVRKRMLGKPLIVARTVFPDHLFE